MLALPALDSLCKQRLRLSNKAYNTKRKSMMDSVTKGMSIKMIKEKELEYECGQMMARRKLENGSTINYIAAARFDFQMATVIVGNTRIALRKNMEHLSILVEANTSGNC